MAAWALLGCAAAALLLGATPAQAEGVLAGLRHHTTVASTITDNGDLNPYAVVVAPTTSGKIQKGDVLVDNFNNQSNLQGTGGTIIDFNPSTRSSQAFRQASAEPAAMPRRHRPQHGDDDAEQRLGDRRQHAEHRRHDLHHGHGCLLVFDSQRSTRDGLVRRACQRPLGQHGGGRQRIEGDAVRQYVRLRRSRSRQDRLRNRHAFVVNKATVLRIQLAIPASGPPKVTSQTVIASGLASRRDKDVFLVGPTGLASIGSTLYVSDSVANRIVAIPDAMTRTGSAGPGSPVTKGGLLQRPLALAATANGHILATNAKNGQVVEFDPASGKQLSAQWVDSNQAQSPPGNGDLFGLAMAPTAAASTTSRTTSTCSPRPRHDDPR